MLKKTIKYTDYNGENREEDFYFNLSKAELMELEMGTTGGLAENIRRIVASQDVPSIIKIFKDIIIKSYGEKSADGKRFVKIDDEGHSLSLQFSQTEAFSVLFTELATNSEEASKFIKGIIPSDINISDEEIEKLKLENK